MESTFGESELRRALSLSQGYAERLARSTGRAAAVLILFGQTAQGTSVLLTYRTESVGKHKGQIAFPGGTRDDEDTDLTATALREAHEEVGILPRDVKVIGALPVLWTVTDFLVTPVVGILTRAASEVPLTLSVGELSEAFWVPLSVLLEAGIYRQESREYEGAIYPVHVYQVGRHRIWGATASMLKNLLDRFHALS